MTKLLVTISFISDIISVYTTAVLGRYIAYLRDNPEGYWFKRKLYGWGWVPVTQQGWLITLLYVITIVGLGFSLGEEPTTKQLVLGLFLPLITLTIMLCVIATKTGQKPRWQWGIPKN